MEILPGHILGSFLKAQYVMHYQKETYNGIWRAMMIENTYMRYGKGPGGNIGVKMDQCRFSPVVY